MPDRYLVLVAVLWVVGLSFAWASEAESGPSAEPVVVAVAYVEPLGPAQCARDPREPSAPPATERTRADRGLLAEASDADDRGRRVGVKRFWRRNHRN